MENTQRDPSSPWKTASGEWRFRSYDSKVYGAASDADVVAGKWYLIGQSPDFRTCECPSFYPLPAATPGFEAAYQQAAVQGALPTHVHKTSCGGDWWQLGTYEEGAPKTLGHFHSTPGWEDVFVQKRIDTDSFYASKDNEYPAKNGEKRRINWGWAMVPPGSAQSLPRVITFNAAARCLEQAPIEELESLRGPAAFSQTGVKLAAGLPMYLNLALGLAKQSEFVATIELPMEPASIRVSIGVSNCTIDYAPSANSAAAFYEVPVTCASNTQNFTQSLRLLASEKTLEIRIFIDWTFMEAFFQKGRATLTFHGALDDLTGISVASSAAATVQSMSVYPMKSIWTSPEEIRKMPRVYPSPHVAFRSSTVLAPTLRCSDGDVWIRSQEPAPKRRRTASAKAGAKAGAPQVRRFTVVSSNKVGLLGKPDISAEVNGYIQTGVTFEVSDEWEDPRDQRRFFYLSDGRGWVPECSRKDPSKTVI
ncbi:unnamed protein product, partial [Polarella glacialis]